MGKVLTRTPGLIMKKNFTHNYGHIFMSLLMVATVLIIGIVFEISPAQAAVSEAASVKYNKKWTIRFNQPVDPNTVNGNIYVVDANDKRVNNIEIIAEGDTVYVALKGNHTYAEGNYHLVIRNNICSQNQIALQKDIIKPFQVMGRNYFTFDDANLPSALTGASYFTNLGSGNTDDATWACVPGSTPPTGLRLDPKTGAINGSPTEEGTYKFTIKKTTGKVSEEKELSLNILSGNYINCTLLPPNTTPGEHMPLGLAELSYPAGIKKQIEVLWNPPAGSDLGSQSFSGYLGGSDHQVQETGSISYLKDVDFAYFYWPNYNWRTVAVNVNGAVREVWMDANYKDGKRTRKMDLMVDSSIKAAGNVFGINTNSLETDNQVTFRLFNAYGELLETREMTVK